jgi:hypothetical protein
MAEITKTSSGVQELIDRIRDQGVQAAREADRLLRLRQRRKSSPKRNRAGPPSEGPDGIEAACVDGLSRRSGCSLDLKARVMSRFEEFVKRLFSATRDKELVAASCLSGGTCGGGVYQRQGNRGPAFQQPPGSPGRPVFKRREARHPPGFPRHAPR